MKKPFINQAHPMDPDELEAQAYGDDEHQPLHAEVVLVGGTVPAHVPGAYPLLSCCGGRVPLVPRDYVQ